MDFRSRWLFWVSLTLAKFEGSYFIWMNCLQFLLHLWNMQMFFLHAFSLHFLYSSKFYYINIYKFLGAFLWIHLFIIVFVLKEKLFCLFVFAWTFEPLASDTETSLTHSPTPLHFRGRVTQLIEFIRHIESSSSNITINHNGAPLM